MSAQFEASGLAWLSSNLCPRDAGSTVWVLVKGRGLVGRHRRSLRDLQGSGRGSRGSRGSWRSCSSSRRHSAPEAGKMRKKIVHESDLCGVKLETLGSQKLVLAKSFIVE